MTYSKGKIKEKEFFFFFLGKNFGYAWNTASSTSVISIPKKYSVQVQLHFFITELHRFLVDFLEWVTLKPEE